MDVLERAIVFATEAHAGKLRKGSGLPYILHPMEVSVIISTMSRNKELIAAGVLHDVVEDAKVALDEIRRLFGNNVARLVQANTENKRRELPPEQTWRLRKEETVEYLRTRADLDEKILIFSDKLSNLRGFYRDLKSVESAVYWSQFNQSDPREHYWYHMSVMMATQELSTHDEWQEYRSLLDKVFSC